jgi:hypothetical protein
VLSNLNYRTLVSGPGTGRKIKNPQGKIPKGLFLKAKPVKKQV